MGKKGKDPKRTTTHRRAEDAPDRHAATRAQSPETANRRQDENLSIGQRYRIRESERRGNGAEDRSPQNRRASLGGRGRIGRWRRNARPAIGKARTMRERGRGNMLHLGEPGGRSAQGTEPQRRRRHPPSSGGGARRPRSPGPSGGRDRRPSPLRRALAGGSLLVWQSMDRTQPQAQQRLASTHAQHVGRHSCPWTDPSPAKPSRRKDGRMASGMASGMADLGRGAWGPPAFLQVLAQRPTPETAGGTTLTLFFT